MLPPISATASAKAAMTQALGVKAHHTLSVSYYFYFGNTLLHIISLAAFL